MSDWTPLCEKCARYKNCVFFDTEAIECNIYMPRKYETHDKSDFSIHEISEFANGELNRLYGMDTYNITEKDIEALKNGKILYSTVNCGEYAIVIGFGSAMDNRMVAKFFQKED